MVDTEKVSVAIVDTVMDKLSSISKDSSSFLFACRFLFHTTKYFTLSFHVSQISTRHALPPLLLCL